MGVRIKIMITGRSETETFTFKTSFECDGLAVMLFTGFQYRTGLDLSDMLDEKQMEYIKPTYDQESHSVEEGAQKYEPVYRDPKQLKTILDKLKWRILTRQIVNQQANLHTYRKSVLEEYLFDIVALTEISTALGLIPSSINEVYISLLDY